MINTKIALTTLAISLFSLPAFAGTAVTNSTTVRRSNGTVEAQTNLVRNSNIHQLNTSQSLKMESNYGDVNISNVYFDGKNLTGNAHSSNNVPQDPVAIGSYASQVERVNISESLVSNVLEKASFVQKDTSHTVSSDAF